MKRPWRETCAFLKLVPSMRQAHAMDYLEKHGQEFCVHFGIWNAEEKAVAVFIGNVERSHRQQGKAL